MLHGTLARVAAKQDVIILFEYVCVRGEMLDNQNLKNKKP